MKKNYQNAFLAIICLLALILWPINLQAQKQMENLDRGVLAVRTSSSKVLISWRILGTEFNNASYNIYRGSTKLNTTPISGASNFEDTTTSNSTYSVSAVIDGVEQTLSTPVTVWTDIYKKIPLTAQPAGGTTPDNVSYTYEANDASVGDLDGDGQYEIVLKWYPTNAKDNAQSGYTGNTILQALELDGTVMWTIDLGKNIRSGAHYTQFMVFDLDGDGKAEVACKTADGTIDGTGEVLGNINADFRGTDGRVLAGPEYLSIFSGETGAFLIKDEPYDPPRGSSTNWVSGWGDDYGNRMDRFLACVAYLDGVRPSVVFCRGYYKRTVLAAYDYRNGTLTKRWVFDSNIAGSQYTGQGNHNLAVGDLDGDGKDEINYGSMAIDDDGTVLYATGFGHGDAAHLGDFDPNRPGLEFFMCHEVANGSTIPALDYRNTSTGSVYWRIEGSGDIGRGITADIDSRYPGAESWGSNGTGIHDYQGNVITTTYPTTAGNGSTYNMCAWFDGDLLRELVDRTVITKWNESTGSTNRVLTAYNYNGLAIGSNNGTKSNPCLIADILGDWREEIIWRASDNSYLAIVSTPNYTPHRIFTLMHDPVYRTSIAWQNVAYNQPAHTGFFLGHGMATPNAPDIYLADGGTLSTENKFSNLNYIKMYPNPTTGELYLDGLKNGTLQVFNMLGEKILERNTNNLKSINLKGQPTGLYLFKINQDAGVKTFKVILK